MKKYLALILSLLTVLAILVACTTADPGADTTADETTVGSDSVTEPSADSETAPGETAPSEETTVVDPDNIVEPDTTASETAEPETAEPDPTGVRLNHERVERQFQSASGVKVTREEVDGEGYVVKITSTGATYTLTANGLVEDKLSGPAIVKEWKLTAARGNLAQGSFRFEGTGPLE